ncbi:type 1 fimbrial protein, partial [Enterobacter cloacae complex sp. P4RS]
MLNPDKEGKIKKVLFTAAFALNMVVLSLHASEFDIGLNGRVTMQGAILAKACNLAMESKYQAIDMGIESVARLTKMGEGQIRPFSLYLTDCTLEDNQHDKIPWHYLEVTFDGISDDGYFGVSGSAEGISLQITDRFGTKALPGKAMPYIRVDNQNIRLDYELRLRTNHEQIHAG